jgi:hypothetical protein
MKDNNNYIEVLMYSNELLVKRNQIEVIKWFTNIIQPIIDKQELYTKKLFYATLKNISPIYLS